MIEIKDQFLAQPSLCLLIFLTTVSFAQSGLELWQIRGTLPQDSARSGQRESMSSPLNWPKSGGNFFNQNYSPLTQISRQNVANLKGVWRVRLEESGTSAKHSGEAQPIVDDGVIYIVTGADDVFALSIETGQILWNYKANLDTAISTICCGWTSRGVALGAGRVYVGQLDGRLVALDQKSGLPVWSIQAERWQDGHTITAAPLYYEGMLIVGFAGGENGTRGRVKAYDAKDGRLIWTFYTIPGPGERGHDTWPQDNDAWTHGGATVWQTPAVDSELGLIYFSTGNPGPDFNGRIRAGDNLFSVSMVALEARTGKYRWHFQQVHHDLWDYDSANPVILFDVSIKGRVRKAVAEACKTGWVYILDRATGKPLLGIDEKPVAQEPRQYTSATQPFPRGDAFVPQQVDIAISQIILINNAAYVVDCGNGVAAQLSRAGVALPALRHVFLTHHHSDHNADYGNLLLIAWASGLRSRVDTWGPPPLVRMTRLFFEINEYDIRTRTADEGRTPLAPLIHAHDLSKAGIVFRDDHVTVRCALVDHPPVVPAFAYRFDSSDRSIVISGDTKYSEALIRLAQGADVLVHEALYPSAIDRLVSPLPKRRR